MVCTGVAPAAVTASTGRGLIDSIVSAKIFERLKTECRARASVPGKVPRPTAATNVRASTVIPVPFHDQTITAPEPTAITIPFGPGRGTGAASGLARTVAETLLG